MVSSHVPSAFLLLGEEEFLKQQHLDILKNKFFPDGQASCVDFHVFDSKSTPPSQIIDTAATHSFLAKKRLIVVKNVDHYNTAQKELLIEYLKGSTTENLFIFESKCRSLPNEKFYKQLSKISRVFVFNRLYDKRLSDWIVGQLALRKKGIHPRAVELLIQLKGNNLAALNSEIEKLVCYAVSPQDINPKHVAELVGRDILASVYDLLDAFSMRKPDRALLLGFDFEPKYLGETMGLFSWQLRRLLRAKTLLKKGWSQDRLGEDLGIRKFFLKRFICQSKAFDIAWIKKALSDLLKFDLQVKTNGIFDLNAGWQMLLVGLSASL